MSVKYLRHKILSSLHFFAGLDEEEWVFRWQQKAFSEVGVEKCMTLYYYFVTQHEEEVFADKFNCVTALQERYHDDIVALR